MTRVGLQEKAAQHGGCERSGLAKYTGDMDGSKGGDDRGRLMGGMGVVRRVVCRGIVLV